MLEAGVIDVGGKFFYVGEESDDEFKLNKNDQTFYEMYYPEPDEQTRRLVEINSIIRVMSPVHRDLIISRKAVIIYRNNNCVMIGDKTALGSGQIVR